MPSRLPRPPSAPIENVSAMLSSMVLPLSIECYSTTCALSRPKREKVRTKEAKYLAAAGALSVQHRTSRKRAHYSAPRDLWYDPAQLAAPGAARRSHSGGCCC